MSAKRIEHVWHIFRGEKKTFVFFFVTLAFQSERRVHQKTFLATKRMNGKENSNFFELEIDWQATTQKLIEIKMLSVMHQNDHSADIFDFFIVKCTNPYLSFAHTIPPLPPSTTNNGARDTQQTLRFNALSPIFRTNFS